MHDSHASHIDPRMQAAIEELQGTILDRYPDATSDVGDSDEFGVVFMRAVVDVDDPDEVTAIVIDRQVDLLVEDGLPLYVVAVRTPERSAAEWQRQRDARRILA